MAGCQRRIFSPYTLLCGSAGNNGYHHAINGILKMTGDDYIALGSYTTLASLEGQIRADETLSREQILTVLGDIKSRLAVKFDLADELLELSEAVIEDVNKETK